jgi:hypothetical protein
MIVDASIQLYSNKVFGVLRDTELYFIVEELKSTE